MLIAVIVFIVLAFTASCLVLNQKEFGKAPSGERLERIKKSPHFRDGAFQNLNPTPQFAENSNTMSVFWRFFTKKVENKVPKEAFHFEKTDLHALSPDENVLIWMGHSSYFIQLDGKKILVDPVFVGYAGPFSFMTKAFEGSDLYTSEDIPELDYLIITHDHWDHLDYETVIELFPKTRHVITGLGTGEHLEYWGLEPEKLIELDWYEKADLGNGFSVHAEPARHFSGRGLKRNGALWASFMFISPTQKIYIGGDSGYDDHFKEIGSRYDSIDLAILETGQYNKDWPYIHMLPGEQQKATKDLKAKRFLPVHNSKFSLAMHSWKEPLTETATRNQENLRILYPKIGEKLDWTDDKREFEHWWGIYE